jgi:hypothetical protein
MSNCNQTEWNQRSIKVIISALDLFIKHNGGHQNISTLVDLKNKLTENNNPSLTVYLHNKTFDELKVIKECLKFLFLRLSQL